MRVAHVAPLATADRSTPGGGVSAYMVSLFQLLAPAVDNIELCNVDADIDRAASAAPTVKFVRTWRFGDPSYPNKVSAVLRREPHDIVHIQHELFLYGSGITALCFPLLLFSLRKNRHVVITVHGVVTEEELDPSLMRGRRSIVPFSFIRRVILTIFRIIAASKAHKIVHSEQLRARLIQLGADPDNVSAIQIPLSRMNEDAVDKNEARKRLGISFETPVLISWGFWNSYKGHSLLVEGFRLFREGNPTARLLLGAGPHPQLFADVTYRKEYEDAMASFRNVEGVDVLGFIDSQTLPTYVRAADASIFAYTKYLAASGPLAFSLSVGTPVLLSSVFKDAPVESQFEPTPEALSLKLGEFFQDRTRFEEATQTLTKRASSDVLREQYLEVYRRVLSTKIER